MAELFNETSVTAESLPGGARCQRLIDQNRVAGSKCRFDRLTLGVGATLNLQVPESELVWGQLLEGSATLHTPDQDQALVESHVFFLPPGFEGRLTSSDGAVLIRLELADAVGFDPELAGVEPTAQFFDLGAEPILQSEHDERTRVYVATRSLFGTTALAGELVIFPAGTVSSNHHHTGAEHFQYILRGQGTVFLNEAPHTIRAGDLVYKYDLERHYCRNDGDGELAFVEFFVPGEWETVWADPERSCTWSPTGETLQGGEPSREIAAHTSDGTIYEDV